MDIGTGRQSEGTTALDNLRNIWLYQQNPELQVSPRRRFTQYTAGLNALASSISYVTQFLNGTPEVYDINDGLLLDEVSITLTDQTANATPATSLQVLNASFAISLAGLSGVYEPTAQLTTTGLYLPLESGTVTTVHGLGLTLQFITPQQPYMKLIRDLYLNTATGNNQSPPQKLFMALIVTIYNPNAAIHPVNAVSIIKYRQIKGIGNEG